MSEDTNTTPSGYAELERKRFEKNALIIQDANADALKRCAQVICEAAMHGVPSANTLTVRDADGKPQAVVLAIAGPINEKMVAELERVQKFYASQFNRDFTVNDRSREIRLLDDTADKQAVN